MGVPLILVIIALLFYFLRYRPSEAVKPDAAMIAGQKPYQSHEMAGYYNSHAELMGQTYQHGHLPAGELPVTGQPVNA